MKLRHMRQGKILSLVLALLLLCSLLVACEPKSETKATTVQETATPTVLETTKSQDEPTETVASEEPTEEQEAKEEEAYYPVEVITYNQDLEEVKTVYEKAPEKVLAIYQSSVDNMLALGLEDRLLAIAGLDMPVKDEYAEIYNNLTDLEWEIPSKEKVLDMKPDMVLSWYSLFGEKMLGDVDFWEERGIHPYLMLNSGVMRPNKMEYEYQDILNLGIIFNVQDRAEKIVNDMKNEIEEAQKLVQEHGRVDAVVLEIGKEGTYRVYGLDSVGGEIANSVGANLLAKENGQIGTEELIALNPEVIFTVYYGSGPDAEKAQNAFYENEALQSMKAIQNKRVVPIVLAEVYSPGVRMADGIRSFINGLYPEQ